MADAMRTRRTSKEKYGYMSAINDNDYKLACETYDLVLGGLAASPGCTVRKVASDPAPLFKHGTSFMRARLLPEDRRPREFWTSSWCFYEIGVGNYPLAPANFGEVQFVMFPDQKPCGAGRYGRAVRAILDSLASQGRPGLFFNPAGGDKRKAILCGFVYKVGSHKEFPVKTAAADLEWLIRNTLPRFADLE